MRKMSLKARLLLMVVALGLIGLISSVVNVWHEMITIERSRSNSVAVMAKTIANLLDRNLFERYGDVQAFASSEPARSGDPERIRAFMNEMMGIYAPVYDVMTVYDTKGRLVVVNSTSKSGSPLNTESLLGQSAADTTWFKTNISGGVKAGTSYIEDLHFDANTAALFAHDGAAMAFSAPIIGKDGKIRGVWRNVVSWKDVVVGISNEAATDAKSDAITNVNVVLMKNDGMTLMNDEKTDTILKNNFLDSTLASSIVEPIHLTMPTTLSGFDGQAKVGVAASKGYSIYPGVGWRVAAMIPKNDPGLTETLIIGSISMLLILLTIALVYFSVGRTSSTLTKINDVISVATSETKDSVEAINRTSSSLASAVTEQAAAVQETAASIEEMNAMVKRSAENAEQSRRAATASQDAVTRSRTTVQSMLTAMDEINASNGEVARQVEESNRKLIEITRVINEIGGKTKVINEIVFQTKLLSFNASVEAARAGEHGKGFAVVAEEVGNLAQMSGKAAKEISDMLDASIRRVEEIIGDTKTRVEHAVQMGRNKVEAGTNLARQCDQVLSDVVHNVTNVGVMVSEISTAAAETATGLAEITKAINQIDQVTHSNSIASRSTAEEAERIADRVGSLSNSTSELRLIVVGDSVAVPHTSSHSRSPKNSAALATTKTPQRVAKVNELGRPASKLSVIKNAPTGESHSGAETHASAAQKHATTEALPSASDPRFEDV